MKKTLSEILHWYKSKDDLPDVKYYFWHAGLATKLIVGGVEIKGLHLVDSDKHCQELINCYPEDVFFYFVEELGASCGVEVSAKELLSVENQIFFKEKVKKERKSYGN